MNTTKLQINKSAFTQFSFLSSGTEEAVCTTYKASEIDDLAVRKSSNILEENIANQNLFTPLFNTTGIKKPTNEKDDCYSNMTKDKKTAMMGFRVRTESQLSQSD